MPSWGNHLSSYPNTTLCHHTTPLTFVNLFLIIPSHNYNWFKIYVVLDCKWILLSMSWSVYTPYTLLSGWKFFFHALFTHLYRYISALLEEGEEVSLENALAKGWPPSVQIIGKVRIQSHYSVSSLCSLYCIFLSYSFPMFLSLTAIRLIHFLLQDILRFHTIYWPSMLLSADLPPPKLIYAHGFLTKVKIAIKIRKGLPPPPTHIHTQIKSQYFTYPLLSLIFVLEIDIAFRLRDSFSFSSLSLSAGWHENGKILG